MTFTQCLLLSSFFSCLKRCPCWKTCCGVTFQRKWTEFRTSILSVVDTPSFEWFILVLIFASSITLCFEDIYLDSNLTLKRLLYWTNFAFSMVFVVEMVLKWFALGFTRYFTSFWTILDFIIVFVRIFIKSVFLLCLKFYEIPHISSCWFLFKKNAGVCVLVAD